ncbi:unnamed protein product [Phytophthora fragariaefolia]|uniref:Unnamed protein product n=1 Tax=Phytophthora fragariaefolia TaxID=1490495 RepID=A0A9W6X8V4_9STRA|nr:unnamed protein product [Phytophthora fragariaefolia]
MAERLVWFRLVDQLGVAFKGTTTSEVKVSADGDVNDFRDAVRAESSGILHGTVPAQLLVYTNKIALDADTADAPTNLKSSRSLKEGEKGENKDVGLGPDEGCALLVVVPEDTGINITTATTQQTAEQLEMSMKMVLGGRDRKRSEYSKPTCPLSKEMVFKQPLGLEYSSVNVNEVVDDAIRGYQW